MKTYYKKIPEWIITALTIMAVAVAGILTFLVIGLISATIDNFFK